MNQNKNVKVVQAEGQPEVVTEVTAQAVSEISKAMRKLKEGRLNERAVLLLIKSACPSKVKMPEVVAVVRAIENLEKVYLKKV